MNAKTKKALNKQFKKRPQKRKKEKKKKKKKKKRRRRRRLVFSSCVRNFLSCYTSNTACWMWYVYLSPMTNTSLSKDFVLSVVIHFLDTLPDEFFIYIFFYYFFLSLFFKFLWWCRPTAFIADLQNYWFKLLTESFDILPRDSEKSYHRSQSHCLLGIGKKVPIDNHCVPLLYRSVVLATDDPTAIGCCWLWWWW